MDGAADIDMANIHYYRVLQTPQGAVLGELSIGDEVFPAIENRSYDDIARPWIRTGLYRLEMSRKNKAPQCDCLRFVDRGITTFLIHRAYEDRWWTLRGCIAVGMRVERLTANTGLRVEESEKAMNRVFELLNGKFEMGKTFTISIDNNVPGGQGNRDSWLRARRA